MILIDIEQPNNCKDCPMLEEQQHELYPTTYKCRFKRDIFIGDLSDVTEKRAKGCPIIDLYKVPETHL